MEDKKFNFIDVLRFFLKWKKPLLIAGIAGGILGAIFSAPIFITPKYEATVIFYPTNPMSASKALVAENTYTEDDFLSMGEDEEAEQMLQILNSDVIMNAVKKEFNLMEHYKINPKEKFANTKFSRRFRSNVKSELTKYTSIKVTVRDIDPQLAANLADAIVETMDSVRNAMQKKRAELGLKIVREDFREKQKHMQGIIDSLKVIASLGVQKYEQQAEALTIAYGEALRSGNQNAMNNITQKLELLSKYGPTQEALSFELEYETEAFVKLRTKLKEIQMDAHSVLPYKYIVENASVPEKKAYPVRWLITVLSAAFAFFTLSVILAIYNNLKNVNLSEE